jgi:hypothetical protein
MTSVPLKFDAAHSPRQRYGLLELRARIAMKKEYVYYVVIALGALTVVNYFTGFFTSSAARLDSPRVLAEKVLHGDSTAERLSAAQGLIQHGPAARKEIRETLVASRGSDPQVRVCLLQAVLAIKDWRSMPEVFEAMRDPDPLVRGGAAAAAVEITGLKNGFLANDPPDKREKIREKMRRDYESVKSRYRSYYPDQEE